MIDILLKQMGFEPDKFKHDVVEALIMVKGFDTRMKTIEEKIDVLLNNKVDNQITNIKPNILGAYDVT